MNRFFIFYIMLAFAACTPNEEKIQAKKSEELIAKQTELVTLKQQLADINSKIVVLQSEIEVLDPESAIKPKLVSTEELTTEGFNQYLNLQGIVKSDNISYVAPRNGMGGYVKQLYIKEGQSVKKGQLVLKLDDKVLRESIEATKNQLSFATNVYNKTKALWDQKIGTEVQLLSAKNNVESLEKQISVQEEQLKTYLVYADQSGIAEIVNIKVGELFSGVSVAGPQIQIINNNSMNVSVDVPENYISKIKTGAKVVVEIPSAGQTFNTTISLISQSINPSTRGFKAECKIPSGINLKPNMAAIAKILNHSTSKAIVIPINNVQSDEKGKYVFVMGKNEKGKTIAQRKTVVMGALYGEKVEILSGLGTGDLLITKGYQNLYEGQLISKL
ncbi:MAG: efflux RND transporter periplasmic adaptor subunit [Saprospiraceae bacterium]|jgi:membrane fusion protein (multidrug efflux system)|nr:efflux RND transporter periplasmic adaptor subunit [Saprospiraceae bacterium]MBP6235205.1 efflux RND transporter periplasmic adaptor subunit [Saprospiraceae bacterium]MBP6569251.1 efflux RND transporter periplasmic adaptor subunit [Saprospiraceae bacterium]